MGGALKNVLAIACGISDGLGFGNNARAALITRGLVEITRLAVASGAHPMTMGGLAGMGDLVLTCTGTLSMTTRQFGLTSQYRILLVVDVLQKQFCSCAAVALAEIN